MNLLRLMALLIFFTISLAQEDPLISILCYHHIDLNEKFETPYTIKSEEFIKQLDALKNAGFTFVSLKDVENYYYHNTPIPSKSVAITFDDGNQNNYTKAYPILKQRHIPFTIFVYPSATGVGNKKGFANWMEIKEMSDNGVNIGSHGYDHPFLTRPPGHITDEKAYDKWLGYELLESKKIIETKLGIQVSYLALPFGVSDLYVYNKTKEFGYKLVFNIHGMNNGSFSDPLNLSRSLVMKGDQPHHVVGKASSRPLFFDKISPPDLSRLKVKNVKLQFKLKNSESFDSSSVAFSLGGGARLKTMYNEESKEYTVNLTFNKQQFYGMIITARDKKGINHKANLVMSYKP